MKYFDSDDIPWIVLLIVVVLATVVFIPWLVITQSPPSIPTDVSRLGNGDVYRFVDSEYQMLCYANDDGGIWCRLLTIEERR